MTVPEEEEREKRAQSLHISSPWDKTWVFMLALVCIACLGGLGTWGRIRMLDDDNKNLEKKLKSETSIHEEQEEALQMRLRRKSRIVSKLRREVTLATNHFKDMNTSIKNVTTRLGEALEEARDKGNQFLSECHGVALPEGYEYQSKDALLFPHDVGSDTSALHKLIMSDDKLQPLAAAVSKTEPAGLFTRSTFPWSQWTWLTALRENPQLSGNFTEWGLGAGGSTLFLATISKLHGASTAGFDAWKSKDEKKKHMEDFSDWSKKIGLSPEEDVKLYDLASTSVSWPEAGRNERVAFTHIDSDDFQTVLGILEVVYDLTVDGGIIAVDNWFHASGGAKRATEMFFASRNPHKMPVMYPVFPGNSVMFFKNAFDEKKAGVSPNPLDSISYSLKYIKGQPEIFDALNRSVTRLEQAHHNVAQALSSQDQQTNPAALCWCGLALRNARSLRDLVKSGDENAKDFEAGDIFRFLSDNSQFARSVQTTAL